MLVSVYLHMIPIISMTVSVSLTFKASQFLLKLYLNNLISHCAEQIIVLLAILRPFLKETALPT